MTNIGFVSKHVLKGQCKEIFHFLLETEGRFPSAIMHNLKTNTVSGFSSDRSGLYTKAISRVQGGKVAIFLPKFYR